jgi:hypothetical protein
MGNPSGLSFAVGSSAQELGRKAINAHCAELGAVVAE